jgi:hypothetical protein
MEVSGQLHSPIALTGGNIPQPTWGVGDLVNPGGGLLRDVEGKRMFLIISRKMKLEKLTLAYVSFPLLASAVGRCIIS